ncbi:SDR family oxidoreductase [Undibacterium flavidum]|uniref:SDR family oxidoreductase n=1 Tax=Undibacterium flavidum TaxID=2762297 RepID=A0ABR6Y8S1_9BURK|nr:SDR family oxidoreductase [Undibacterium flavidum]MBC3872987.1 SDR family oxidoreductase [Undibacterium flavidum]
MTTLTGKIALITGASSGIGYATAKLFANQGAQLVLAGRDSTKLNQLVQEIHASGGQAIAQAGDVRDEEYSEALVNLALGEFGGLDIAFNNAGILGRMGATPELTLADWEFTLQTNLSSAFLGAKYQLPAMLARGAGSLIFTSSFVGYTVGFPGMAAYAASKAGLIGLTQALAIEFGTRGVRVNALLPGGTDTPMGASITATPEARSAIENLHGLKRLANPDEIAKSALYLASDASSFTTGTALLVDGGISINRA